jgi:hypothetical protein
VKTRFICDICQAKVDIWFTHGSALPEHPHDWSDLNLYNQMRLLLCNSCTEHASHLLQPLWAWGAERAREKVVPQ